MTLLDGLWVVWGLWGTHKDIKGYFNEFENCTGTVRFEGLPNLSPNSMTSIQMLQGLYLARRVLMQCCLQFIYKGLPTSKISCKILQKFGPVWAPYPKSVDMWPKALAWSMSSPGKVYMFNTLIFLYYVSQRYITIIVLSIETPFMSIHP